MPSTELHKKTCTQQVIDYIRNALRCEIFKPGDSITEQMLADQLGASRAPIREALQQLTNEGLITTYPYRGRVIKVMTPQEILDNAYIIGSLEGALAVMALKYHTQADYDRMHEIVSSMSALADNEENLPAFEPLGSDFHNVVSGCRHMPSFNQLARQGCHNVAHLLYFRHWKKIFSLRERAERHKKVLDAVLTGDIQYIQAVMRRHQIEVAEGICRHIREEKKESGQNTEGPETA